MTRKLFAALLFALGSLAILSASVGAVDVAPAPRLVGDDAKKPAEAKGKFGGFGKGSFDPAKLKDLKEKFGKDGGFGGFGKGGFDPAKLKDLKGKFGKDGGFGKGNFDPAKFKEMMKGKFGKDGGFGGKGGFGKGKGPGKE